MEFTKLSEVEALTEVPENATVLAEVDGVIKRIPGEGLGGAGIATAIIKSSNYDSTLSEMQSAVSPAATSAPAVTYTCTNMTFEEAYALMASGEPLSVMFMDAAEGCVVFYGNAIFTGVMLGVPCIILDGSVVFMSNAINVTTLYWTADGLSTEAPTSSI